MTIPDPEADDKAYAAPRRGRRAVWLLLLVVMVIAGVCATAASAYTPLFRPFVGQPLADPCAELGVGPDGGAPLRPSAADVA